ncbi:MAG: EpsG family protein, partial [Clostridia bacterium]|nr:EpsG family protein [Clostridia bacterium]
DIGNYLYDYNSNVSGQVLIPDKGYNILRYCFSNFLKVDFFTFHIFVALVCIALIRSTILYTKANENLVIGLFMSYLFFIDTIQIRNLIVESIFIFAARYLFTDKKFNTLKYIICIFIACLFHKIALIYLILLVCKLKHRKPLINACFVLSVAAFLFFMVSRSSLRSLIILFTRILNLKTTYNFTETRLAFIPVIALYFAELFVMAYYRRKIKNSRFSCAEAKYLECIVEVQMLLAISLPLLLLNMNFYRIVRNILILKYIAYAMILQKIPKKYALWWGLTAFIIVSTTGWFISDYMIINNFAIIAEPIFTGNLILNNTVNNIKYSVIFKVLLIFVASLLFAVWDKLNSQKTLLVKESKNEKRRFSDNNYVQP